HPERLIHGDSRQLLRYDLPAFDFSMTSPPYMHREDPEDPFANYSVHGEGYAAYMRDIVAIYEQVRQLMKPGARVVLEVANLKSAAGVTPLAWDVAQALAPILRFEGEVAVGWEGAPYYGYNHSYCLVFTRPSDQQNGAGSDTLKA
ncbi:MAG TPA: class I SAM-dependent methyltransferase, partial [Roseiflexaceae bacterium]|nr:class I SAM-dependent methyltransferase [Roseiflexaceae bacterium]